MYISYSFTVHNNAISHNLFSIDISGSSKLMWYWTVVVRVDITNINLAEYELEYKLISVSFILLELEPEP